MYRTLATIGQRSRSRQSSLAETNPEPYLWPAGPIVDVAIVPVPDQPVGPVVEIALIPKQQEPPE